MADDLTIPHELHKKLRGRHLHPVGPRWQVATREQLDQQGATADDVGHVAVVGSGAAASWWLAHSWGGGAMRWRRWDGVGREPVEHTQAEPAAEWVIPHGMDCYPPCVVMDEAGRAALAEVRYPDRNTVVVSHSRPKTGRASVG